MNLVAKHGRWNSSSVAHVTAARCRAAATAPVVVSQLREQLALMRGARRWYSARPPSPYWPPPPPAPHPHVAPPPPHADDPSFAPPASPPPSPSPTLSPDSGPILCDLHPSRVPILRPALFVLLLSSSLIVLSAALDNLSTFSALDTLRARLEVNSLVSTTTATLIPERPVSSSDLAGVRQEGREQRVALLVSSLGAKGLGGGSGDPDTVPGRVKQWIAERGLWPLQETEATIGGIVAINVAVFLAWRIPGPRWNALMRRNWMHDPAASRMRTMFTHMWSHQTLLHLFLNMNALSFGAVVMGYVWYPQRHPDDTHFGNQNEARLLEATPRYHFLGFYISAGLFSSLASALASRFIHLPRCYLRVWRYIDRAARSARRRGRGMPEKVRASLTELQGLPSLGASGAIYACITVTAFALPDTGVSVLFFPYAFPIVNAVACIVAIDFLGIILAWRRVDHAAHLGGAAFGLWWVRYGVSYYDWLRLWLQRRGIGVAEEEPTAR